MNGMDWVDGWNFLGEDFSIFSKKKSATPEDYALFEFMKRLFNREVRRTEHTFDFFQN